MKKTSSNVLRSSIVLSNKGIHLLTYDATEGTEILVSEVLYKMLESAVE